MTDTLYGTYKVRVKYDKEDLENLEMKKKSVSKSAI